MLTQTLAALSVPVLIAAIPLAPSSPSPTPRAASAYEVELTTTYTLQPLLLNPGDDRMRDYLAGRVCGDGSCINVDYPASLASDSRSKGADNLQAVLSGDPSDGILVFAGSQGAQAVSIWLERYGTQSDRQDDVTFLLVGSPEIKGGFRDHYGFADPTTPEDSGYTIISVAGEYDGWAMWPDRPGLLSTVNAFMGMTIVHNKYDAMDDAPFTEAGVIAAVGEDPNAETNLVWKSGEPTTS